MEKVINDLLTRIKARADNAYLQGIAICRQDACLGEQIKMEKGIFGPDELKGHRAASEAFGKHKAFNEVLQMFKELDISESSRNP